MESSRKENLIWMQSAFMQISITLRKRLFPSDYSPPWTGTIGVWQRSEMFIYSIIAGDDSTSHTEQISLPLLSSIHSPRVQAVQLRFSSAAHVRLNNKVCEKRAAFQENTQKLIFLQGAGSKWLMLFCFWYTKSKLCVSDMHYAVSEDSFTTHLLVFLMCHIKVKLILL